MNNDRGASLVLIALTMTVLIGAAALAVDIGAIWMDRSTDQKITDSAAAAGAIEAITTGGQTACESALAYVAVNASDIPAIDATGCAAAFTGSCNAALPQSHTPPNTGRYTITVIFPVPDNHPLMTSGIVGAGTQALDPADGDPCERVGVEMTATRDSFFAQVLGFGQGQTTVHTVATAEITNEGVPLNLLVLDRDGCQAIQVSGNGGISVDAVIAEDLSGTPTGLVPGIMAADSDGSAGCASSATGVISIEGSNASLRADGPQGCADETGTHPVGSFTAGEGCGLIQTVAPGTPGCEQTVNLPACSPGAGGANQPKPAPTALPEMLTRRAIDHRYNCWSDYTSPPAGVSWAVDPLTDANEQSIPGCSGQPYHIYNLINAIGENGPVGGYTDWFADLGHPCDVVSSNPGITVAPGNVRIDCPTFTVASNVQINGNVVFDGDVHVTSATANLMVNNSFGSPGVAFFRGGTLTKDGQANLTFNYTAVYMSKTSRVAMSGGDGSLTWIAPDSGNFDDLALWSDSPLLQQWAGQANLVMEGVFFTPWAQAEYAGTSGQNQTNAQWIAHRLHSRGQGQLVIRPAVDRAVPFTGIPETTLIR